MSKLIDRTGDRYGRLVVVGRAAQGRTRWGEALWTCACDCGATTVVSGAHLAHGGTASCGCVRRAAHASRTDIGKPVRVPGYVGAHRRLRRTLGRAADQPCAEPGCDRAADDWSYVGGDPDELTENGKRYSLDPSRYRALCHSHHVHADQRTYTHVCAGPGCNVVFTSTHPHAMYHAQSCNERAHRAQRNARRRERRAAARAANRPTAAPMYGDQLELFAS